MRLPTVLCGLYFGYILHSLDSMCEVEVPNWNNLPPEANHQKACLETLRELFKGMEEGL